VNKTFPLTERVGLQLRAEAFNAFNHPNINAINATYTYTPLAVGDPKNPNASTFGFASNAGDMRQMEFSGRITF
jgi:hypothetical protein